MYKKVLAILGIMAIGMTVSAKPNKNELLSVEQSKAIAIEKAKNQTAEFLSSMKANLVNKKEKPDPNFGKSKGVKDNDFEQFLYQNNLVASNLDINEKNIYLKKVYEKLIDKQTPTHMNFTVPQVGAAEFKKIVKTGKDQGKVEIDSTKFIIPVSFEVHTIAKDNLSDVKYSVQMKWEVETDAAKEKIKIDGKNQKVIVGYKKVKDAKLYSASANSITYFTSDKANMAVAAKKAIKDWYSNLPQTLDATYAKQSYKAPIKSMDISLTDIKMATPNSQKFKVTDVPEVEINIDPYQFISNDPELYTNPVASLVLQPEFDVTIDNDFKNAELAVTYKVVKTNTPVSDDQKYERFNKSQAVISDLSSNLSEYVASPDSEQKTTIIAMFETDENDVEVSHMSKRGKEQIKTRSAKKYISRLKGEQLSIKVDDYEIKDSNLNTIIYKISQGYQGKRYSDYTQKLIHLKYDSTKGIYLIYKIEVVPNSTIIQL